MSPSLRRLLIAAVRLRGVKAFDQEKNQGVKSFIHSKKGSNFVCSFDCS